jgi:hypothetical protein
MVLMARILQSCGSQQAADHVGAERRFGALHGFFLQMNESSARSRAPISWLSHRDAARAQPGSR